MALLDRFQVRKSNQLERRSPRAGPAPRHRLQTRRQSARRVRQRRLHRCERWQVPAARSTYEYNRHRDFPFSPASPARLRPPSPSGPARGIVTRRPRRRSRLGERRDAATRPSRPQAGAPGPCPRRYARGAKWPLSASQRLTSWIERMSTDGLSRAGMKPQLCQ